MAWPELLAMADRAAVQHLGGPVTYTPGEGEAAEVQGVFDAAYSRADVGEAGVSGSGPAVFLILADLPSDPATDSETTITVKGVDYRVWGAEPDGQGGVLLMLHVKD